MADMDKAQRPEQGTVVTMKSRTPDEPRYSYWVRKRMEEEARAAQQEDTARAS